MSTYPVDIKAVDITSASTTTVFNGPARVLGVSWTQPTDVAAGTITVNDNTTAVWVIHTSLKVTNAITTHVTVYYG
jgi:hypothetical protein